METKGKRIELSSQIVTSYIANNPLPAVDLPSLIQTVYQALTDSLAEAEDSKEERVKPIVSVRSSVKRDHIVCLVCGKKVKVLKRHLSTAHNLTPEEYKRRFRLPKDYPLVAPDYAETRTRLAKQIGLGRKAVKRA
jgi:predicted transcriptional regulator